MALKPELEAMLATLENDQDRASMRTLLEKYPDNLAGGYLRQADYDRNMNTGGRVGYESDGKVADQTIHHDASRPSRITLPVIPR